ncbi:hypothetical protein MPL3365_10084 [Mesorhizobium plurifarium]|uniref:Uncharacterized protein n=1 Tax=Mesorhizobium plurifarium TaxID=69974 RepID=A0A090FZW5_MESPL|nr:hypothetical protein MPL3365_10084 [Mesorhizobium plurifarium]
MPECQSGSWPGHRRKQVRWGRVDAVPCWRSLLPPVTEERNQQPHCPSLVFALVWCDRTIRMRQSLAAVLPAKFVLKRVAIFQIRSMRFRFLILRMSLSRKRFPLSGDML